MARHGRTTPRRRTPRLILVIGGLTVAALLIAGIASAGDPAPAAPIPAPPAVVVAPAPSVNAEHHIQEAAATPVDVAATEASERVTRDRQGLTSNAAARAVQTRLDAALDGAPLTFGPDTAMLTPESRERLARVAEVLRAAPSARVEVVGHTAVEITNPALCLQLSQLRAEQVASTLAMADVDPSRLVAVGVSHSQPRDTAAESRRAELVALTG